MVVTRKPSGPTVGAGGGDDRPPGRVAQIAIAIVGALGWLFLAALQVFVWAFMAAAALFAVALVAFAVHQWLFPAARRVPSIAGAVIAFFMSFGPSSWADLLTSVAVGLVVGIVIGVVRYRSLRRNERFEAVVDALGTPEVLSVAELGWTMVALHVIAGVLSGAIVAWLGLSMPELITGEPLSAVTPVIAGLISAGLVASGGGLGGGDGGVLYAVLALLAVLLIIFVLTVIVTHVAAGGLWILAKAMAEGGLGTFAKSIGIALGLVLVQAWEGEPAEVDHRATNPSYPYMSQDPAAPARARAHMLRRIRAEMFRSGWLGRTFAGSAIGGGAVGLVTALLVDVVLVLTTLARR